MALAVGISTGRGLASLIHDALVADPCLTRLLEEEVRVDHGTEDWCDEQASWHELPPVRRSQMGWPGHFHRAVVTFGEIGKFPFRNGIIRPNLEEWVFKINIFVRSPVVAPDGSPEGEGDLYAQDIYHAVIRILGWDQTPPVGQPCGPDFIVFRRQHIGDSFPLQWVDDRRWWQVGTRFNWWVLSRGLVAPPPCVPCGQ
jgi:hypothetical protein